jgi:mRNA-degrading endonuclease RelE of RelBE toxin-antitoxin system
LGWTVSFNDHAARQLRRPDRTAQRRILDSLSERIAGGDHRIVCRLDDASVTVTVVAVGHRREVYR